MAVEKDTEGAPLVMQGATESIGFMLSKVGNAVSSRFGEILSEYELVPRQFFVLNLICQHEGESQQAIAGSIGVAKSQMVSVVDELEAKGYLERRVNPDDRRQHALFVTKSGKAMQEKAINAAREHELAVRSVLSKAEAETLLGALHKIAELDGTPIGVHASIAAKLKDE
ncbi:MAG: winged helix-turn-helix transcriptional regulator [Thermoleophilaceae bacterium]|nr:winged helix-turn-helix transcriptional regulator [Thermoleophilaceae bacterium]